MAMRQVLEARTDRVLIELRKAHSSAVSSVARLATPRRVASVRTQ